MLINELMPGVTKKPIHTTA